MKIITSLSVRYQKNDNNSSLSSHPYVLSSHLFNLSVNVCWFRRITSTWTWL